MKLCITPSVIILIAVMIVVVGLISAAFIVLGRYFAKTIKAGRDDKELTVTLKKKFKKARQNCNGYVEFLNLKSKKQKTLSVISSVFYITVTVIAVLVAALAVYSRAREGQFFLGNRAYVIIATGSMSQRNEQNPYFRYLAEHPEVTDDMGQIPVSAFVEIKRGNGNYNLYDVVAFEHRGVTYVHRIIPISEDGLYTTMGDSNNSSLPFEKNMPASMIIGVYSGKQNITLGKILTFLKSNIGIITLAALIAFLFMASIAKTYVTNASAERTRTIAENLDRQNGILGKDDR